MVKLGKRGAGHIEFILSFILFVGVISFAIFFFNPTADSKLVDSTLPFVFSEFRENVDVELDVFSIIINKNLAGGNTLSVELKGVDQEKKVRVESYGGNVLNSVRNIDILSFDFNEENFVFVKFSKSFLPSTLPSERPAKNENYYEVASSSSREIMSEEKVRELADLYYSDYDSLKERFKLPGGIDFSFVLAFSNEDFIDAQKDIPQGVEVFSKIRREEVIREDGTLVFADLSVSVW